MKYIIDRLEEEMAVCENESREMIPIPLKVEFMADDAGIFRERVVAVIDVYIGTTDPGKSNFHPYFMGARNWNRT